MTPDRKEFTLTKAQMDELLDASKPTPVMYLPGGQPMFQPPQENANEAWARLGKVVGFKPMTVQPVAGKKPNVFSAEPTDAQ